MKRMDYISWDEYFMGVAMLSAGRSKDPGTQVGACIVDDQNRILSTGYNGFPHGCSDDEFPWNRDESLGETKYQFVVHAELNAILNSRGKNLAGSKLYVSLFPCHECAKAIIQAGVREVVYLSDKYKDTMMNLVSKRMLEAAGVKYTQLRTEVKTITLDFTPEEIRYMLDLAKALKAKKKAGIKGDTLTGKNIVLLFEKTSTRTRCAFEVAAMADETPLELEDRRQVLDRAVAAARKREELSETTAQLTAYLQEEAKLCLEGFLRFRMRSTLLF